MSSRSKNYELLAQSIYQTLHNAEGFSQINVQHNIDLPGASGCEHQIDVFWSFTVAGVTHRVAVECKHYADKVEVGQVRDFFGVIHDVGNIHGVFLTKTGYQSGAKKFADHYHIDLYELREPTDEGWDGPLGGIELRLQFLVPHITAHRLEIDPVWKAQHSHLTGQTLLAGAPANLVTLVDGSGNKLATIAELANQLPRLGSAGAGLTHRYTWPNAFIDVGAVGRVPIVAIEFDYDVLVQEQETTLLGQEVAKALLKNVKDGTMKFFNQDGGVRDA